MPDPPSEILDQHVLGDPAPLTRFSRRLNQLVDAPSQGLEDTVLEQRSGRERQPELLMHAMHQAHDE